MKHSILIFIMMGLGILFFGCSENNLTAPETNQFDEPTLLEKTKSKFTANAIIDCKSNYASPGTKKVLPNGDIHLRGVKAKFIMKTEEKEEKLLNGELFWHTNKNIEKGMYKAKLWGKVELRVTDEKGKYIGKWDLTWHGYKIGRKVMMDANGVGVEGKVKGMVTKWSMGMELIVENGQVVECAKAIKIVGYISK